MQPTTDGGLPAAAPLLAAVLLGAWGAAGWLAARRRLVPEWPGPEQGALAYALGVAGLVASCVLCARLLGQGYGAAASGAAGLGLALTAALAIRRAPPRARRGAADGSLRLPLLLGSVPPLVIAATYHTGDWGVHYWNAAAIQNGWLPLPHPAFPELEASYHYAVDLLAATLGLLLPVDVEWIFDTLALAGWTSSALLGAALVRELVPVSRARAQLYALAFGLLGAGATWLVLPVLDNKGAAELRALGLPPALFEIGVFGTFTGLGREIVNFPTLHYFFNPPMTAGLPLALAVLHLYLRWLSARERACAVAAGLCLGALGLAQVALFFTLGLALGCHAVLEALAERGWRGAGIASALRRGPLPGTLALGLGGLGLAVALGGFVAEGARSGAGPSLAAASGLRLRLAELPLYYAATLGVPGLLGAIGALWAVRARSRPGALLLILAAIGVAVPHLVWYPLSNVDNLKFFTVASLALGLLAAPAVESLRARAPGAGGRAALAALVAASCAGSLAHVAARVLCAPDYVLTVRERRVPRGLRIQPLFRELWPREMATAAWLRRRMGDRDRLLVLPDDGRASYALATTGRFGASGIYAGYGGIRVPPELGRARQAWYARARRLEPAALCEGPRLFVFVRQPRPDAALRAALARAAAAGALARERPGVYVSSCAHEPDEPAGPDRRFRDRPPRPPGSGRSP